MYGAKWIHAPMARDHLLGHEGETRKSLMGVLLAGRVGGAARVQLGTAHKGQQEGLWQA